MLYKLTVLKITYIQSLIKFWRFALQFKFSSEFLSREFGIRPQQLAVLRKSGLKLPEFSAGDRSYTVLDSFRIYLCVNLQYEIYLPGTKIGPTGAVNLVNEISDLIKKYVPIWVRQVSYDDNLVTLQKCWIFFKSDTSGSMNANQEIFKDKISKALYSWDVFEDEFDLCRVIFTGSTFSAGRRNNPGGGFLLNLTGEFHNFSFRLYEAGKGLGGEYV